MRCRMRILGFLSIPAGLFGGLGGTLLRDKFDLIIGAGEERDRQEGEDDACGPMEAAVAAHFDEFLAGDGGDHGGQSCMVAR